MSFPPDDQLQSVIDDIIEVLPLRDLVSVANMDQTDVQIIQQVAQAYLRRKLDLEDGEEIGQIMDALWQRLKETHRLRAVK